MNKENIQIALTLICLAIIMVFVYGAWVEGVELNKKITTCEDWFIKAHGFPSGTEIFNDDPLSMNKT